MFFSGLVSGIDARRPLRYWRKWPYLYINALPDKLARANANASFILL
jgi:hypothetical protein